MNSSSVRATGNELNDRGSFPGSTASRPALEPNQPPIQRLPAGISLGIKRSVREADHKFPSCAEVKNIGVLLPNMLSLLGA
jgi:hypothetical protein